MPSKRIARVNELLQREIAKGLYRIQTDPPLDLARVTISGVDCSPDLRKARVMVSVLHDSGDAPNAEEVVRTLNRKRKELQALLASNIIIKYTPHLQFFEDHTLDNADRVLEILDHLPPPADPDDFEENVDDEPEP